MKGVAGFRNVKVLQNVNNGQIGLNVGTSCLCVEVTNNGATKLWFHANDFPTQGHPMSDGIPIAPSTTREIPMTVYNFTIGQLEIIANTVVGTISTAGNATVTVTAVGLTGSPIVTQVAVALNDTPTLVAGKIVTALQAVTAINNFFTIASNGAVITLTAKVYTLADNTMSISVTNGTCVGLTLSNSAIAPVLPVDVVAYGQ